MSGKGSKQRPGAGYAQGYAGIDWGKRDPEPTPCDCAGKGCTVCAPTEDGPGQEKGECKHDGGLIARPEDDMSIERCIACGAAVPSFLRRNLWQDEASKGDENG